MSPKTLGGKGNYPREVKQSGSNAHSTPPMHSALIPVNSLAGMKVHEKIGHNYSVGDRSQDSACSSRTSSQLHPGILSCHGRMQRTLDRPCRLCFCQDPPVTNSFKPNMLHGPTLGLVLHKGERIKVKESHENRGTLCDCAGCVSFQLEFMCFFPFFSFLFPGKENLTLVPAQMHENVTRSGCFDICCAS